jgi:hypothetical protein
LYVVLRHSQISVDVTSRAPLAFSRAADIDSTIEQPPWVSRLNATKSVSDQTSSACLSGGSMPSTRRSVREVWSGSTLESSSNWCTVTSRMRAVSSARST